MSLDGAKAWPAVSRARAHALLTAPGATFEVEEIAIGTRTCRTWKNGPKSLVDLWRTAARFAPRTFMVAGPERITYDAFRRAAHAFASALVARGVRKGDRVALLMANRPEWVVAFYGAALVGAIAMPLNISWTARELAYALRQAGARVAIVDAAHLPRALEMLAETDLRLAIVCGLAGGEALPPGTEELEAILGTIARWSALPAADAAPTAIGPEDGATLFYTSGTVGRPKGALASHRAVTVPIFAALMSQARAALRRGETLQPQGPGSPQKISLLTLPLFHVSGCFAVLNVSLAMGGRLVFLPKWDAGDALALIAREGVTSLGGVPTMAAQILDHPDRGRTDLSTVASLIFGGAPVPHDLVRRLATAFPQAQIGTGWGMTETCGTFTHLIGEDYIAHPGTCGLATVVGDAKIVDARGRRVAAGEIGELLVYGPHVVDTYWNLPEETAATFRDGWLRTGDLATLDGDGFCTIVDRVKDVIIRGGENIYCPEVEDILCAHAAVVEAALVPIAHPTLGEVAGAVVTVRPGWRTDEDALKAHVAKHLAAFKIPAHIMIQAEPLPRNAIGKVSKVTLRHYPFLSK